MREAVTRRYRRMLEEKQPMPSLILIDGGIGQLHAAAQALESLQIINQPLASIAKKEEILVRTSARKMSQSFWIANPQCCTLFNRFATKRTVLR